MTENMNEDKAKAYELRELTADDMFPMFQIISKIGIKEFKSCFESENVRKLVASMSSGESGDELKAAVGVTVVLDIASVILSNIGNCKDDIYLLLAQLSGMKAKDIAKLPMSVFMGMIIDVIKKKEFADFFQDVVKLFK
jgi:hypothetical protein